MCVAGKRGGIAPEHPRKDPIATVVVDNVPLAAVADMECGKVVGGNIVDHRNASSTTTGYPDRSGSVGERSAGGKWVDS